MFQGIGTKTMEKPAIYFFEKWCQVCKNNEKRLLNKWENAEEYTTLILKGRKSITKQIAKELDLEIFYEYYSLDAVFYKKSDIVKNNSKNKTWRTTGGTFLTRFKIVFEHENIITGKTGGYQEICHLLVTNSELKILVGYLDEEKQKGCAEDFHSIIASQDDKKQSILLILGSLANGSIKWNGYILNYLNYKKIPMI